jgi:predicted dehydrogenase
MQSPGKRRSKLAVFQNRRWDSDFKTVKQVLAEGVLGEIVEAEFHFDRYNPVLSPKQRNTQCRRRNFKRFRTLLIKRCIYLASQSGLC